ncbi:MAG: ASCH domain-containing protein [Acidobacteriota bacterium]
MLFTKRLREGVRNGTITCSVRIWQRPKVTVGRRYAMEQGEIEIDSLEQIALQDITHQLAIESGFFGVIDMLKVAKHGPGENVYLIRFHYGGPNSKQPKPAIEC